MAGIDGGPPPGALSPRGLLAGAAALALLGAIPFFLATTFVGDDHLFLAFARYAPNPLAAFVRDHHGGEFYRPVAMLPWWVLGRLFPGHSWPFAALAFVLHTAVAFEVAVLSRAVGGSARTAVVAAILFFVGPAVRNAAYWYAASTDLLATAFGLGAVLAVVRRRGAVAVLLAALACWSKESAVVIPLLAIVVLRAARPAPPWRAVLGRAAPLALVAVCYAATRTLVLGGLGGSGDRAASVAGKLLQLGAGLLHVAAGDDVLADGLSWTVGIAAWLLLLVGSARATRRRHAGVVAAGVAAGDDSAEPTAGSWAAVAAAWAWIAIAVAPLLAAPWIVGARYFYLAAAGVAWLAAGLLERLSPVVTVGVCAALAGLTLAQTTARRGDIVQYQARLGAARRAVASGTAQGYTTFHIASGIKDLDLAIKNDPTSRADEASLVVLGDVPASFIAVPTARAGQLDFLLARPPLPPSGAYHFGTRQIVGLARRGDDPTVDEVLARLPGIRFIRLRLAAGGRVVARDVTETWRGSEAE